MQAKAVALFDFDGTLCPGDSIAGFVRFCRERKHLRIPRLLRILLETLLWKAGLATVEKVKTLALSPLAAMDPEAAEALCADFARERLIPALYPEAVAQMRRHMQEGRVVLVVSASPHCYLRHLQGALSAEAIIGTPSDAGFRIIRNVAGEEKCRQIRAWLDAGAIRADWVNSFAYGDSVNDMPMLRLAGHPVLVNPGRIARRRTDGIAIVRWGKTSRT